LLSGIRSLLPSSPRISDNSLWDQRRIAPYASEEVDVYEEPAVEEFRNDWPPEDKQRHERELGFREIFLQYILPNKMLWMLAVANIFVYIARYAMVDWGPTYLKEVKGASLLSGGFRLGNQSGPPDVSDAGEPLQLRLKPIHVTTTGLRHTF